MYGENGGNLRAELSTLLRQHRVQQRLGGAGTYTVPETTNVGERAILGTQIARYRQSVLVWCLQAVRASSPQIRLEGTSARARGPAEELRFRLTAAIEASATGLPSLDALATEQEFPIVETWRRAARAATLGEHDFGAGLRYGDLTEDQCMTVLKDAAEITRGLVGLDRRYANIPDWDKLKDQGRLGRAAEVCTTFANYDGHDYAVDHHGWHPPLSPVPGPSQSGIAGVLQAEYNLLAQLSRIPDAHSLRLILESQRIVSHNAGERTPVAPLAGRWNIRAQTYLSLIRETRNVYGVLGNGGPSAAQAATAVACSQRLSPADLTNTTALLHLDQLFIRIDSRVADLIEHGADERIYLRRVRFPRITNQSEGLVKLVRMRHIPIDTPPQTDLLRIVREELRPSPCPPVPTRGASDSRREFHDALVHQPPRRDPQTGVTRDGPSL